MVGASTVVADIGMTYVYYIYIDYIFTYTLYLLIAYSLQFDDRVTLQQCVAVQSSLGKRQVCKVTALLNSFQFLIMSGVTFPSDVTISAT